MTVTPNLVRNAIQTIIQSPQFMDLISSSVSPVNNSSSIGERLVSRSTDGTINQEHNSRSFGSIDREVSRLFRSRSLNVNGTAGSDQPATMNTHFNFTGSCSNKKRKTGRTLRSGPKSERESYPTFNMTVILIPEQKCSTVPRGRFKASLINHGFVLFAVNFRKDWDAEQLQEEVLKLFQGKLKEHDKIDLLRASGLSLVKPKISQGLTLTGDIVHRCWGKSTLYVRPKRSIPFSGREETDVSETNENTEDELPDIQNAFETASERIFETTAAPSSETTVAPSSETTVAPSSETTVAPSSETTVAPSSETTVAPSSETTAAPSSETTAASSSETTAASSSETTAASSSETTAASSSGTTAASSSGTTAASSSGTTAASSSGTTAASSSGTTATSSWQTTATSSWQTTAPASCQTTNETNLETSATASGETSAIASADVVDSPIEIKEIISGLNSKIYSLKRNDINVNRANVLDGTLRAFKRKSFDPSGKMNVVFTDDSGQGEGAADAGGPSREFFRLVLKELMASNVFEGPPTLRSINMNASAVSKNMYYYAGYAMALSLVHGGPGPQSLAPWVFECLYNEPSSVSVDCTLIVDKDLRERVMAISNATNLEELLVILEGLSDIRFLAGCDRPILDMSEQERQLKDVTNYLVMGRHLDNLNNFKNGLSTLGVLEAIKNFPDQFRPVMTYDFSMEISRSKLNSMFTIRFSERGGNRYTKENLAVGFWRDYLIDVEEGECEVTLAGVLIFTTGAESEPPLGFIPKPSIEFLHEVSEITGTPSRYPMSNTCAMILKLPIVHQTYEQFKDAMDEGIICSPGFGQT